MTHETFSKNVLDSLENQPSKFEAFAINDGKQGNTSRCMTKLLCNRLRLACELPQIQKDTTYEWNSGTINIRNAAHPRQYWTNIVLNSARELHEKAEISAVVYLLTWWRTNEDVIHCWALPEPVLHAALPCLREKKDKERRMLRLNRHRKIAGYRDSPDLTPYYRALSLTKTESRSLVAAYKVDKQLRRQKATQDRTEAETSDFVGEQLPFEPPRTPNASGRAATGDTENNRRATRYWAVGAGEGGRLWNEFQERGIIAIGWDDLGDLTAYPDRQAIAQALLASRGRDAPNPNNDSLACIQFRREMVNGDFVVVKIGRSKLLGVGVITSDYGYDTSRKEYRHVRKVRWLKAADIESPHPVPTKTLTDVTDYKNFVDFVQDSYFDTGSTPVIEPPPVFTLEEAMAGLFMSRPQVEDIISAVRRKKNVVLQGPPGVGKTFVARQLAYAVIGRKDPACLEMVQFHQSYSYEDFIQGWRPQASTGFRLRTGVFYHFCNRARLARDKPFVFIIDEINRGNLSKIFGELLMLIEGDKRGPDFAIPLTYCETPGERFSVPENVHILGLMNTADRSLALVDYALRRRFVFIDLEPQFVSSGFRTHLQQHGVSDQLIERILTRFTELNEKICADVKNLGPGFAIGHSFFCCNNDSGILDDAWYRSIIDTEIAPLLREYWFESPQKAKTLIGRLLE